MEYIIFLCNSVKKDGFTHGKPFLIFIIHDIDGEPISMTKIIKFDTLHVISKSLYGYCKWGDKLRRMMILYAHLRIFRQWNFKHHIVLCPFASDHSSNDVSTYSTTYIPLILYIKWLVHVKITSSFSTMDYGSVLGDSLLSGASFTDINIWPWISNHVRWFMWG